MVTSAEQASILSTLAIAFDVSIELVYYLQVRVSGLLELLIQRADIPEIAHSTSSPHSTRSGLEVRSPCSKKSGQAALKRGECEGRRKVVAVQEA